MIELIITNIVSPILAALITWRLAKRQNNAGAQGTELENIEKAITVYRKMAEDLHEEMRKQEEIFKQKIEAITRQHDEVLNQLQTLKKQYNALKSEHSALQQTLSR